MALLDNADRFALWTLVMQILSHERTETALAKADLRAAIDAADAWVDANKASYNSAIPQPARGVLTAEQKAQLLSFVILRRFERGA